MNAKDLAAKFRMLSTNEIDLLQHCVKLLPSQPIIVNIGANIGTSTCAILEANPNAFVFSIDVKPWPEERENVIACGLDPSRVVRLLGDSAQIGKYFPYEADLVFVDGGHDDKAVRGDIEAWMPKCRGVILYHDYHHPRYAAKPEAHLDQIVDEAMRDWERIGEARYLVAFRKGPKIDYSE